MLANDIRNYRTMDDYIAHHGILGQKWGVRRFQDKSGRLTAEGKKRRSEYYDNGLKKPKGKLIIHKEVGSDLTDAGKQFKKDVENHVVDFYASMPEERLKKIRDTYSEYKSLDAEWRGGDKPLSDKKLKRLNELEKEWDDMSSNLTKECMGKTFVSSNPEWDKDAYDIAWEAHLNTSRDIYEGSNPKAIKSERERRDRFDRVSNMYENMSESDLEQRRKAFKDYEEAYDRFINAPDTTSKNELQKLKSDVDKTSEAVNKTRQSDIKKIFKDMDLDDYYVKRDVEAAFADVSDKYIYSPVRKSMKSEKENKTTQITTSNHQWFQDVIRQFQDQVINFQNQSNQTVNMIQQDLINNTMMPTYTPMYFGKKDKNLSHSDLVDEVYSAIWDEDYISHHGILGQKWGKKNGPPYPLAAGSHSSSEKKAASAAGVKVGKSSGKGSSEGLNITQSGQKEKPGLIGSMIEGAKNAKLNKQRKQALEKAREAKAKKAEEKAAAEAHEAERQKALDSGDYNQIQKYANESSYEELQRAMNKANVMQQLNQKVVDSTPVEPSLMDQIDKAADVVSKATNAATKGIGAWNKFAEVYNTFVDPDSMLPEIGKNWSEEKEKRIKAKEKEAKEAEEKARKARVEEISKKLDPKLVMKNQKLFTKDELQEANNRLVTYSQLKEKADAIDKEAADAKAKKQAEKAEAKAKKEFEAQQAKERAKNDYLEDIENRQYNFGDDDSGFKASNPTFKKAVKEAYDYFDNDSVWGSTNMSSASSSSKAKSTVDDIWEVVDNPKSNKASDSSWNGLMLTQIWDID